MKVILLSTLNDWWEAMAAAHQVFWFIAIIFSVLFFIQFVLSLVGPDTDTDLPDAGDSPNFDTGFSALSVRSIIAFFTFFGWTGVLAMNNQLTAIIAVLLAVVAGLAAMFIVAYLMVKFAQLEQSGTLNLYNALDQSGEVYLTIPANGEGRGKIHLNVDGRIRELDAITDGDILATGTPVKVIEILEDNLLKVQATPTLEDRKPTQLL